jgi:hypothetical protein
LPNTSRCRGNKFVEAHVYFAVVFFASPPPPPLEHSHDDNHPATSLSIYSLCIGGIEGCLRQLAKKKFGTKNSDCQKNLGLLKYIVSVVLVYMSSKNLANHAVGGNDITMVKSPSLTFFRPIMYTFFHLFSLERGTAYNFNPYPSSRAHSNLAKARKANRSKTLTAFYYLNKNMVSKVYKIQ